MSGKFGIAFVLICTLLIQMVALNTSTSNLAATRASVSVPAGQSTTVLANATATDCTVDPKFYVPGGASKPDANFGVGGAQAGVDAGFHVAVCKGVSTANPITPGGK